MGDLKIADIADMGGDVGVVGVSFHQRVGFDGEKGDEARQPELDDVQMQGVERLEYHRRLAKGDAIAHPGTRACARLQGRDHHLALDAQTSNGADGFRHFFVGLAR